MNEPDGRAVSFDMRFRNGALGLVLLAGAIGCKPARSTPRVVTACEPESPAPPEPLVAELAPARPVENLTVSWRTSDRALASIAPGAIVLGDGHALFAVDAHDGKQTAQLRAIEKDAPFTFALAQVPGRIGVLETFSAPCPDQPYCTGSTHRLVGLSPAGEDAVWSVDLGFATALRSVRAVASDRVRLFLVQEGDRARAFDVDGREQWSLSGLTRFGSLSWELAADRLLVADETHTMALQPERGCSFWSVDEAMLGSRAGHVITVRSAGKEREIRVRAASNGAIEHRFATAAYPERSAIVGTVLLVHSSDRSLAAYDLQTDRALWTRSGVEVWTTSGDAVFVSDRSCVLRALSPASGVVTYAYSLACDATAGVVPRLWAVASEVGDGIAFGRDRELVVLARAITKAPPVSKAISGLVRVNGKLAAGVHVSVGEQVVLTGNDGRYSARVTTPGSVMVLPHSGDLEPLAEKQPGNHPECQLSVKGPGYPPPPVAIDAPGAEQTLSFDLEAFFVCIGH